MKLFELTTNTRMKFGRKLTQIRATVDFKSVKAGDLGGWIEDERSISDDCWVHTDGEVFRRATMYGGEMYGGEMYGGMLCGGEMYGGVMRGGEMHGGEMRGGEMYGGMLCGGVMRGGVMQGGEMHGGEMHGGEMYGGMLCGGVMHGGVMRGGVMHGGVIEKDNHIGFANVGSENGYLLAYIIDGQIMISRGCFHGTIDEFYSAVNDRHSNNEHGEFYKAIRPAIEMKLSKFVTKA